MNEKDIIKEDLSYVLDQDYKKVKSDMVAIKRDVNNLSTKVDTLTTKIDSSIAVSEHNTKILNELQSSQQEVIDALRGKTVLGQQEEGALTKVNVMYEYYEKFLDPNKKILENLVTGVTSFKWLVALAGALGISSGALIYMVLKFILKI